MSAAKCNLFRVTTPRDGGCAGWLSAGASLELNCSWRSPWDWYPTRIASVFRSFWFEIEWERFDVWRLRSFLAYPSRESQVAMVARSRCDGSFIFQKLLRTPVAGSPWVIYPGLRDPSRPGRRICLIGYRSRPVSPMDGRFAHANCTFDACEAAMTSHVRQWDHDKGIRVTMYLVCIIAVVVNALICAYVLR